MKQEEFFEEPEEQSKIKSRIVAKYFWAWATAIRRWVPEPGRIAYIDLFSGPGRYHDGTPSTPLLILERAIRDPVLRSTLLTHFNDSDGELARQLGAEVSAFPDVGLLRFKPKVTNFVVGQKVVEALEHIHLVPSLVFLDPWGYKGLSLDLVNAILKDWACECIFFFNYRRINAALENKLLSDTVTGMLGVALVEKLRAKVQGLTPQDRELTVMEGIVEELSGQKGRLVLPFCFKDEGGRRTSHYLVFVTKHPLGYTIMKDIMYRESTSSEQGVATFEYRPASREYALLFEFARPLEDLEGMLLNEFAGRQMKMKDIFEQHHLGKRYVGHNYKQVLAKLEAEGKILTEPAAEQRRKGTFADGVVVTFPAQRNNGKL